MLGPYQNEPAPTGLLFLASGHSEVRPVNTGQLSSVAYESIA
jgi:hypothetical protein